MQRNDYFHGLRKKFMERLSLRLQSELGLECMVRTWPNTHSGSYITFSIQLLTKDGLDIHRLSKPPKLVFDWPRDDAAGDYPDRLSALEACVFGHTKRALR